MPLFVFTVRRLMVVVAVVAGLLTLWLGVQ